MAYASSLFKILRPKQWVKNILLLAAPFAAGKIFQGSVLREVTEAFISFSLIASAGYIINDLKDVERDRNNIHKAHRPLASGALSVNAALVELAFCFIVGFLVAFQLSGYYQLALLIYFAMTAAYSFGLKHQPVVEFVIVAFGFTLRAIAGAAATHLPITQWFLVVTGFGSLVIVIAKRIAESTNTSHASMRPVIEQYPPIFLRFVLAVSASVTLTAFSLWAFGISERGPYAQMALIPVCLGLFRYIWMLEKGEGERPEELLLKDVTLLLCSFATVLLLFLAVYRAG